MKIIKNPQPYILITAKEAALAKTDNVFLFAQERFLKEHGIRFSLDQLQDQSLFKFEISDNKLFSRITFVGKLINDDE